MKNLILIISLLLAGNSLYAMEIEGAGMTDAELLAFLAQDDLMNEVIGNCAECGRDISAAQTATALTLPCGHMYGDECYPSVVFVGHCLVPGCGRPIKAKEESKRQVAEAKKAEAPKKAAPKKEEPKKVPAVEPALRGRAATRVAEAHQDLSKTMQGADAELVRRVSQLALRQVGSGAGAGAGVAQTRQCAHCDKAIAHDAQPLHGRWYHAACKSTVQNLKWLKN